MVKNIPEGVKDYALGLYLNNLTGVECEMIKVQMKDTMAIVEIPEGMIGKYNETTLLA